MNSSIDFTSVLNIRLDTNDLFRILTMHCSFSWYKKVIETNSEHLAQ